MQVAVAHSIILAVTAVAVVHRAVLALQIPVAVAVLTEVLVVRVLL
jgi:hypothetical protein